MSLFEKIVFHVKQFRNYLFYRRDIVFHVKQIEKELVSEFWKTKEEAKFLVKAHRVKRILYECPSLLHDSPTDWALVILSKEDDVETIIKWYTESCWECGKAVNVAEDDYYLFEPSLSVLCKECCDKEGIDLNGEKIR